MKAHKRMIQEAIEIIDDINGDMSVPDTVTLESLEEIQGDLEGKIEALREQIKNREGK